jgi:predicted N-acetyltransferase YhbS
MTTPEFQVRPERAEDIEALRQLAARSFGPGRFARAAHRVREHAGPVKELSLTAWSDGVLAGSIRFTAIGIGASTGALLLGPLMVDTKWAGKGCGRALIASGLELAREAGYALVLLVGDLPYYERFGFARVPAGKIAMPGPVDPARLLAMELEPGALQRFGGIVRGHS